MARRGQIQIANNAGVGATAAIDWPGGKGSITVEATFGGGNIALQMQTPNGTWVQAYNPAMAALSFTVAGIYYFDLCAGPMRVNITTATAVFAYVIGIPLNVAG